jgi:hypothetical protein
MLFVSKKKGCAKVEEVGCLLFCAGIVLNIDGNGIGMRMRMRFWIGKIRQGIGDCEVGER